MKAILIGLSALMVAAGANAAVIDFDLGSAHDNLGPTHTYTVGGLSLKATGYDNVGATTDLFGKHNGGNEDGLGLANDPTGDKEIHFGSGFVQLDISQLIGKADTHVFKFETNSTTNGEEWAVFGSDTAGSYSGSPLLTGTGQTPQTLTDLVGHTYYDFVEINHTKGQGDNFLIESFSVTPVPEPATWAMLLAGVFGIGAVARSARRPARLAAR